MLIRRFFAFVISAFLIFFPAYSYATTSVGGWTAVDTITAGATNTINATKTAGGKVLKSAITIAPQAGKVGKLLLRGGGAAALLIAVPQLLGDGVDWVLDPANNSVKYKPVSDPAAPVAGSYSMSTPLEGVKSYPTADQACAHFATYYIAQNYKNSNYTKPSHTNMVAIGSTCDFMFLPNNSAGTAYIPRSFPLIFTPFVDPSLDEDGYKKIPIDTVAAQVISNAAAGHAPSQEAVKATALEGFAAGEHDAALDAAATEAGTQNPPDTENPPKDGEAVPFDPSSIIAAIDSVKAVLTGMLSSMTGFFDWAQAPVPPDDQEKKDVPFATTGDVGLDEVDRFEKRIDFAGQCPVNDFSFTMMGVTYAKPIPYYHLCGFLEQIAPWLLAMCYLGTAYFVVENI